MNRHHDQNPDIGYERQDFRLRHLAWLLLILVVLVGGGLWGVHFFYGPDIKEIQIEDPRFHFTHSPEYETPVARDRHAMLTENRGRLTEFSWTNKERGHCRIPLRLAIEALAAAGPPDAWRRNPTEHPERKEAYLELRLENSTNE